MLTAATLGTATMGVATAYAAPAGATTFAATAACPTLSQLHKGGSTGGGQACFISKYVNPFIKFFAGVVGVFVVISLVWGGIQYASSADDPSKVSAAKQRIMNAIIALLAFFMLFAFLQWIVPGGAG